MDAILKSPKTPPKASLAKALGIEHRSFLVSDQETLQASEQALKFLDEPVTSSSFIPLYLLSRHTKPHVTVVLSGQGADELFGGYDRYRAAKLWSTLHGSGFLNSGFGLLVKSLGYLPTGKKAKLEQLVKTIESKTAAEAAKSIYTRSFNFNPEFEKSVEESLDKIFTNELFTNQNHSDSNSLATTLMNFDLTHLLSEDLLLYGDRMSMAHELELRVPLLDLEFVNQVKGLAESDRYSLLPPKKKALRNLVPEGFPSTPLIKRKLGFVTPINAWIDGASGGNHRDSIFEMPSDLGIESIINKSQIEKMYKTRAQGNSKAFERELWAIYCLGACKL